MQRVSLRYLEATTHMSSSVPLLPACTDGIWMLWTAGTTATKLSVSQSIATACPGTAMPNCHDTALDSPVLSLALP